ncbi:transglycosylase family protein [Microlunatus soli]|uniref:Peptidoglycan-binding (PGRP) domain of peptidoglycan hydrolases-containing protein n=1 Tax=Microlunatus soli TaxID=630515 RepID=A0A1H2AE16_9ACTN|nr:transglycosylase family protein [Microlunatus soli]SDT44235.1 Peptidoglycan-binding (PGRP) domain of peptidoglycan hydrolases-containing protein [Microlunatus soli]
MPATGRQPVARRVDLSRPAEPATFFKRAHQQPRRAVAPARTAQPSKAPKAAVGVLASAALVGGLGLATAEPASAAPIGHDLPKLSKGKSGAAVTRLQRELSAYGPNVSDTGYFGTKTTKRVKRVQRLNGWKQTGVAGSRVWHELLTDGHHVSSPKIASFTGGKRSSSASTKSSRPRLHHGDRSGSVKRLQRELSKYGPSVPTTGYFGDITSSRVKNLQRREDLKVTGVAGKAVWRVLLNDDNKPYKGSSHKKARSSSKKVKAASYSSRNTVWDRLAQCEAGGNWSINTGNGFYGGLQFTLQTWRGYGGSGMPHHASRAEQIRIGKKVQKGQGWGAWPACSSKLGLR